MLSFQTLMSSNILMFSLLLFCSLLLKVFCQNPITNLQVLDTYLNGASKFIHNSPIFDGITLVLPKTTVQHSHRHPHHHHHSHRNHHRPQSQPIFNPFPLAQSPIAPPFHQLLLSPMAKPDYQPVFRSVILPNNYHKHRKSKKNSYKAKYRPSEMVYHKQKKAQSKYPKSINDRLREKDYDQDDEENKEENEREVEEEEEDPMDHSNNQDFEKPTKSYYDELPPFGKQKPQLTKPMFKVKSRFSNNRTKDDESSDRDVDRHQSYRIQYPHSEPKYSERLRKPILQNDSPQISFDKSNQKTQSLFDSSPPFSNPDQFNFLKPMIQTNNEDTPHLSDSPQMNDYPNESPKKQRTATANQLYLKEKEKQYNKSPVKEEKIEPDKVAHSISKDDLDSNDDPGFYPHQYAIEIRWKDKNNVHYNLDAPEGDVGDREMHSSKELDHARHRKYKHEEEEHWHEKKWLNEGLRKAYLNGKHLPVRIVKPTLKLPDGDYSPLPIYAQPIPNGATLDQINQHFAIPTPNFRVNNRFMEWAKNAIPFQNNPLQNLNNYLTLFG